jgi:hypothetical protein
VKVGDLVKFITSPLYVGVITFSETTGVGIMYYIQWTDGARGACWGDELEIILDK